MFDKPLFSSKQLNIIIIVTLIAIVLLTASGNRPDLPELNVEQILQVPTYWTENSSEDELILSFSFALPKARMGNHPDTRLLFNLLRSDLNKLSKHPDTVDSQTEISLRSMADRLQITLKIPEPKENVATVLNLLFPHLMGSLDPNQWQQERIKQYARSYLDNQSTNSSLLQLQQWLQGSLPTKMSNYSAWQQFRQQLMSRSQLRIAILSPNPEMTLKQLQDSLSLLPLNVTWQQESPTSYSLQQRTISTLNNYQLWMARHTVGKDSKGFMDELVALKQLRELAEALNITASFTPLATRSQLLLHLNTTEVISAQSVIERLQMRLLQTDNKTLDTTKQKMIDRLHENSQNSSLLIEQLEAIAFYQLPVNYLQQLNTRIQQLDADELRQQVEALLDPQMYHWILEEPAAP